MKYKDFTERFTSAVLSTFGRVRETQAAKRRRNADIKAKGDSFKHAVEAAFVRQFEHNTRARYRRNTRGLPIGVGVHQLAAARALEKFAGTRPEDDESIIGDTRLNNADTVLEAMRKNRDFRNQHPRSSKIARRVCTQRYTSDLKTWCANHAEKIRANPRKPYIRPTILNLNGREQAIRI